LVNSLLYSQETAGTIAYLSGAHKITAVDTVNKRVTIAFVGNLLPAVGAVTIDFNNTAVTVDYVSIDGIANITNALGCGLLICTGTLNFNDVIAVSSVGHSISGKAVGLNLYIGGTNLISAGGYIKVNQIFSCTNLQLASAAEINGDINTFNLAPTAYPISLENSRIIGNIRGSYSNFILVMYQSEIIGAVAGDTVTNLIVSLVDESPLRANTVHADGSLVLTYSDTPLNLPIIKQVAPAAKTVTATLTADEVLTRVIQANPGGAAAATYTMPTGTNMQAALGVDFAVDDAFEFTVNNISTAATETVTMAGNTGMTAIGSMTIAANSAVATNSVALFRVRKTGNNAFSFMKVA
jgi:hypothetical protein